MNFPQLYTKTSYSLLKSTLTISEYVKKAKELGYKSLALTDEHVLYGAVEFYQACIHQDIKPIIGMELDILSKAEEAFTLLLYAKNLAGYQNLMRISSQRMIEEKSQHLAEYEINSQNLMVVLPISKITLEENIDYIMDEVKETFHDTVFLGCSLTNSRQIDAIRQPHGLPLLALHEVKYLKPEEAFAIDVMKKIQSGKQISKDALVEKKGNSYLLSEEEINHYFQEEKREEAISNAISLAESCQFEIPLHQKLLPHYPLETDQNAKEFLEKLCWERLPLRVNDISTVYQERLAKELSIIHTMGFDDYFLIVWDVMDYAHRNQIVTGAGRGSAAGSLVAYVLSITDVDPIQYNLLFERFLNPERNSMPDIDLDIPDNRRNEILHYVKEKYGRFHVAQIATFGTMAAKMVLRDVGRVFGLSQSEASRWSKSIPNQLKITLRDAYEQSETLKQLVNTNSKSQLMFQTALSLEGLPRHVSTHAAGVVISDQELISIVPLQNGSEDILLTQFTMSDIETIGLLKMDFLGLRNLSIIDTALRNIKKVYQQEINLKQIPLDDPQTLELFQRGETSGVFQFESAGIRNVLRRLGPTSIEDIAAVNALYRPGPMQNIDHFIARKKGKEAIQYPEESLKPILENTYGIIVYQEQIMQVAARMAGFSLGQADILRRAVSKKKKDLLDEERQHFVSGSIQQGYTQSSAEEVYDYIERFANYGFNRSHAFAYSFVGYQMAYLKVHYPGPFYAALLKSVRSDAKKMREYIAEANQAGVSLLAPDINKSFYSFTLVEKDTIRFGLDAIKGIRRDYVASILAERKAQGFYKSLDNFLLRIEDRWLKEEYIEPLIVVGAFDELHENRRQLQVELEGKIQNVLYSGGSDSLLDVMSLKEHEVPEYSLAEKLDYEEKYLGLYVSGHPTENYPKLKRQRNIRLTSDVVPGQNATILIYLKELREIRTKKGEQMAFLNGNDQSGELSLTIFPILYRKVRNMIHLDQVYLVSGKIEKSSYDQSLQLLVEEFESADTVENSLSEEILYLRISSEQDSRTLHQEIAEKLKTAPGNIPVILYFEKDQRKIVLGKEYWIGRNEDLLTDLRDILGNKNVVLR
ncbi:DNA polymerase III subunit alpha [Enterococcus sp. AZ072]|uniref:DNA polymerase III subunit alpha n=1 Tax=unclassified Enterococcus TaxID=2608891 RepID=UPI003D2BE66C